MYSKMFAWLLFLVSVYFGSNAFAGADNSLDLSYVQEIAAGKDNKTEASDLGDSFKVDINSASAAQIADALKGVGTKKAAAIVAYRDKLGGFERVEQLLDVKGIGESTLEKNRSNIKL